MYDIVHLLCKKWKKKKDFTFSRSAVIKLASLLNHFIQTSTALKVNALLLTSRPQLFLDPHGELKTYLNSKGHFKVMDATELAGDEDIPKETDIIITDTMALIDRPQPEIFLIEQFFTDKDMRSLNHMMQNIKTSKLKQLLSRINRQFEKSILN